MGGFLGIGSWILAVSTNILNGGLKIDELLRLILNVLVYGLGAAAVIGVVWAGILYLTARDNESQVVKAKMRLFETVLGLAVWAVMYVVVQWLVPGYDDVLNVLEPEKDNPKKSVEIIQKDTE